MSVRDAAVGIDWTLKLKVDYKKILKEAIAQAFRHFRDWVNQELKPPVGRLGKIVPVYEPRYYQHSRAKGKTEELRESVEIDSDWENWITVTWGQIKGKYASHVREHGHVRTPGTSADWVSRLKKPLRDKLFSLITIELRKRGVRTAGRVVGVPGGTTF